MPRPIRQTGPDPAAVDQPPELSGDQIDRLAEMIADGRADLPDDLLPADRRRLLAAVRPRLRTRLVRLIAEAITCHIRRQGRPKTEKLDARTQV